MRRDSIFYRLFSQNPTLLFDLISVYPNHAANYQFDSVEIKETSFRIDGVFLPPDRSGTVFFCEVQFQLDDYLYERMLCEAALYFYRYRDRCSDWQLVAIYPTATVEQSNIKPYQCLIDAGKLIRIYLDQLGAIDQLPLGLALMVLTILEDDDAKTAARQLVDRAENERAIIEMITTIMVYKFTTLTREEIETMIGMSLKQTKFYQDVFAEGEQAGEARGEVKVLLKQLQRRFGVLPPVLLDRISNLSVERLDDLAEALLDWQQVEALTDWLETIE